MKSHPLVVNLYGGPGSGKSTAAAMIYSKLKMQHLEVELVTEFAKDLTYEERFHDLGNQIYVFGEQYRRMDRLFGSVDIIITDSPLLLSCIYSENPLYKNYLDILIRRVSEYVDRYAINVLLQRESDYKESGRKESMTEAEEIHMNIENMLKEEEIDYINVLSNPVHIGILAQYILDKINRS